MAAPGSKSATWKTLMALTPPQSSAALPLQAMPHASAAMFAASGGRAPQ